MTDQKHTKHEFHSLSCHHGRLARKCEICESQDEIKFLSTKLTAVTKQRDKLREACLAALEWYGLDGDGIGNPVRAQLESAITKTEESV